MAADPVEVEASGQLYVEATYLGHGYKLPMDAESWPLSKIAASIGFHVGEARYKVDFRQLIAAMAELLGDQWPDFLRHHPQRRELVPASHAFATTAGFAADKAQDADICFGSMPRLLGVLAQWPDKVESDLDRFWGIDYRDRFRRDTDGRPLLTLRQISARLNNLPADSSLAKVLGRYSVGDLVLMDVFEVLARQPHPLRPLRPHEVAERRAAASKAEKERKAKEDYRARKAARSSVEQARVNAQQQRGGRPDGNQDQAQAADQRQRSPAAVARANAATRRR